MSLDLLKSVSFSGILLAMGFSGGTQLTYQELKELHLNSDADENPLAIHHTLGPLAGQASPGDHVHDGKTSKRINFYDIEGGLWNIDGGIPDTIYTPIPAWDGGGV
jgi:hypothetical protein